MVQQRKKRSTQVNSEPPSAVRELARQEGREIQAEEALGDPIEKRTKADPRSHVMGIYLASHEKYRELYKHLAE